ncbi:MAG TPA: hypothetical protein VGR62_03550 [Candidatus Binatia bacterium]|jgi:hypothetical protein|nr:hypothetical protein [Candidatus Binatia bacterium]
MRHLALLAVVLLSVSHADAHWFGFATNAYTAAESQIRLRPRVSGTSVTGVLRCRRPASGACVGRVGQVRGTLGGGPGAETMQGTLSYPSRNVVCQVQCDVYTQGPPVPRPPGPRSFWYCTYDGCTGGAVAVGTFTTQRF